MVEQMVCERNKAHCSPIRRRFLKIIVAALLLTTAAALDSHIPRTVHLLAAGPSLHRAGVRRDSCGLSGGSEPRSSGPSAL